MMRLMAGRASTVIPGPGGTAGPQTPLRHTPAGEILSHARQSTDWPANTERMGKTDMEIGMVGLGRMGANMTERLAENEGSVDAQVTRDLMDLTLFDADGNFVVVWESEGTSLDGSWDIFARRWK